PGDDQRALTDAQRGLGGLEVGQRDIVLLGGDDGTPAGLELPGPLQLALGLAELGPGLLDIGLGLGGAAARLVDPRLEQCAVEPGQHRPLFHARAVADRLGRIARVGAEALDPAGDLGTDVHDLFGLDRARRVDRRSEVAAPDHHRAVGYALRVRVV